MNLILGLFILSSCSAPSQLPQKQSLPHSTQAPIDSLKISHEQFNIDRFNTLYVVTPNDELLKLNADQVEFRYSNSRLGTISSIDVSNPLAIICFYQDFQTIVLLDRTLNTLTEIDLGEWSFNNVTATCSSGNNQLWIYDASDMQLVQIAKDRATPIRTFPINLHSDEAFIITKMLVKKGNLYCLSAKGDLYKLSLIGESLQKILDNEQYTDFQFSGNRLLLLNKQGQIFHYRNPLDLKQLAYPLAQKNKWGFWNGGFLFGDGDTIRKIGTK